MYNAQIQIGIKHNEYLNCSGEMCMRSCGYYTGVYLRTSRQ